MDLLSRTVAHYQITGKIGEGGMGVVYRAFDTRLARNVAIKVLPESFSTDPERVGRFEREARILADLGHPNIGSVYGLEEADGRRCLILELVEGKTLADRLRKGRIGLEEALEICRQIALALEAAHEEGIIHSNLKPSNIKLTPEGKVKILGFGLAKAMSGQAAPEDSSQVPIETDSVTGAGIAFDTAPYMSPEQAAGKPQNKRTDIWAFGCVLYECLTGKKAFEGDTITEVMAAILKNDPDWSLLPTGTPETVQSLLRECLRRDPNLRLHDIVDARIQIGEAWLAEPAAFQEGSGRQRVRGVRLALIGSAIMMLIGGALALTSLFLREQPTPKTMRFVIPLPAPIFDSDGDNPALAISADGQQLAYVGGYPRAKLYYRRLDDPEFKSIEGLEGVQAPFFSPDGRWLGFFADGRIKKVAVGGGPVETLTDTTGDLEQGAGSWGYDDRILFQAGWRQSIFGLPASGGVPKRLIAPDFQKGDGGVLYPQKLPFRDLVLFTTYSGTIVSMKDAQIAVESLGGKFGRRILTGGTYGRYLSTGHLVYGYDGKLMAAPLDLARLRISASPVQVLDGIRMSSNTGMTQFAVSETGHLVYVPGTVIKSSASFMLIDRNGREQVIPLPGQGKENLAMDNPSLSPDGSRIAVHMMKANDDIHIYDLSSRALTRVTFEAGDEQSPVWHPDSRRLVYTSEPGPGYHMYMKNLTAGAEPERILSSENPRYPSSFSPDGTVLAFVERNSKTGWDIWMDPIEAGGQPAPFRQTEYQEYFPAFSPDGHWIAYQSDKSGQPQVYVARYPDGSDENQVSLAGGTEPRWAPSGKELFFRRGEKFLAVAAAFEPTFSAGEPRVLFVTDQSLLPASPRSASYTVMPDGQQFVFVQSSQNRQITQLHMVVNWFEELKRLVPNGKD